MLNSCVRECYVQKLFNTYLPVQYLDFQTKSDIACMIVDETRYYRIILTFTNYLDGKFPLLVLIGVQSNCLYYNPVCSYQTHARRRYMTEILQI